MNELIRVIFRLVEGRVLDDDGCGFRGAAKCEAMWGAREMGILGPMHAVARVGHDVIRSVNLLAETSV